MKVKEVLLKLKNEDYRFRVMLDEWTSGMNWRFFNVNEHTIINTDNDIVGITTDGASVMKKVGRLIEPLQQLCYAHGVQLGITDVIYKNNVESNEEEEFEDPELNTNRSAEEAEVLYDNPDNYDDSRSDYIETKKMR
ncbi:unnamed protein product [Pieris brassicae]|uniref:Uncharacterized protein n=1 Tax=Pieris brassicae TaxID=7116 RepID=A0A9P0XH65_PIEBR|nr:unnamed protein product [Pieris brassicae]